MANLKSIETWRAELGLLPVPLFGEGQESRSYILLNGARGNFCLNLDGRLPDAQSRNEAWSSNVGHYVTLHEETVYIQRWDSKLMQTITLADVVLHLERFHRALEEDVPTTELSVIAHALRVFRTLRAALGEKYNGSQALKAFLYLLAAAVDRSERQGVSSSRWELDPAAQEIASSLTDGDWNNLFADLTEGHRLEHLRPDLRLTLRHASGVLFQEAHYAAVFESLGQMPLPGLSPSPVGVKKETAAVGLHFTPPAIARTLVEESLAAYGELPDCLQIFDPACGSGEFLRETLRQLRLRGYAGAVRLIGFDLSPTACDMARFTLAWETREGEDRVNIEIRCCDALRKDTQWPASADLILMNPPFQSWRDMVPERQEVVRRILGEHSRLRPDLSTAFLWRAAMSLGEHAVLGSVLPASFLDGASFRSLRADLGERLAARLVARLGSHGLFQGARIDASFYVAGRGLEDSPPLALWADHRSSSSSAVLRTLRRARMIGQVSSPLVQDGFSIYPNSELGKGSGSWAPRPYQEWQLLRQVQSLPNVAAQFEVRQGTITGNNRAFLLDKAEWLQLDETERKFFRPCVLNESVRGGRLRDDVFVFYPYGVYQIESEEELRHAVPTFYRTCLAPAEEELRSRSRIRSDQWWVLSEHRAWQVRSTVKLVSTYFGDAGSFAWDEDGEYVVVQGYGWIPNDRRKAKRSFWLAWLALLNSSFFSSLLAATSNHLGGGQWNLSKRFVEPIPLPNLTEINSQLFADLAEIGVTIHESGLSSLVREERRKLDELSETVYLEASGKVDTPQITPPTKI